MTLTPAQFHILLTLSEGKRHGYRIMQEIKIRTNGGMELGPGTLYRSIKQLLTTGLIVELEPEPDTRPEAGKTRRLYDLTPLGRIRTAEEAERLQSLVRWARDAMVLEGNRG